LKGLFWRKGKGFINQNMVRADLFSGFLAVWNVLGFAFYYAHPPIPSRAKRGEDRIPFELFLEYTALYRIKDWAYQASL